MDEEKALAILEEVDDDEIREILRRSPEAREAIHAAMNYAVDSTAFAQARKMMQDADVPEGVRKDMILGWLEHRRKDKEVMGRLKSGNMGENIVFNVSFGTDSEVKNVQDTRRAFGLENAEDATVERE